MERAGEKGKLGVLPAFPFFEVLFSAKMYPQIGNPGGRKLMACRIKCPYGRWRAGS
jgi:hypothetical protein